MEKKYQQNYTLWVFVWMVCNAKCTFCNAQVPIIWEKDYFTFYSLERIKKDILVKKDKWATCIIYEWWDFSLHPKIFEILEFWQKLWIKQTFQTNWIKLANLEFVKKLRKYWVHEMNFSIHAFDAKTSDKIMWVKWVFEKTIQWVINCNKEGIIISNNFVLVKDNLNQLEWIVFLMLKLNIKLFNITMYIPVDQLKDDFHDKFLINPVDAWKNISGMLKLFMKLNELTDWKLDLRFKFHNVWRCILDKDLHDSIFEFDLDRRKESNKDYSFNTWFYKKKDCKKCIYNNNCTWFTEKYIEKFGEDYIKPILN